MVLPCSPLTQEWRSTITQAAQLAAASRQQRKRKAAPGTQGASASGSTNTNAGAVSTSNGAADPQGVSSNGVRSSSSTNTTTTSSGVSDETTSQATSEPVQSPNAAQQGKQQEDVFLSDGILRAFQGTSPSLIGDICLAAGVWPPKEGYFDAHQVGT